ncbi:hypothetical protein ACFVTC_30405 [Streptomyces sp. NPDC057950]|uniref:hypothetical protein n=1 Tax=Streptomyces sp. NPDC057950 TaxID=3346288 RepID=UPI0036F0D12D
MRRKLRMYIAVGTAGAVGSGTGLLAAHLGMDPAEAAHLGAAVSGATGDLLRQLLRVSQHDLANTSADPAVTARTVANTSSSPSQAFRPVPRQRPPALPLAAPMAQRTAHHGRHRQLQRSARRFAERAVAHSGQKEGGHGAA